MPKGPLIKDAGKRRLVIAIVMGVLLFLSLLAAAVISGAGWVFDRSASIIR